MFTNSDIAELTALRRELHLWPELSGAEEETDRRVVAFMAAGAPDKVLTGLGGTGVALVYDSGRAGPSVMIRAELDALKANHRQSPWSWPLSLMGLMAIGVVVATRNRF